MSKYSKILDAYDSYDKYKDEFIDIAKSKQYDKELFEKIVNFNFDQLILFLKIVFFPLGIIMGIMIIPFIIDSVFNIEISKIVHHKIFENNIIPPILLIPPILGVLFMTKIYIFRKEYIYIKYALYTSIFYLIIADNITSEFRYILLLFVIIFNIIVFIKYRTSIFKFYSIPLSYNKKFISTNKQKIKQIKCNTSYSDIRISFYDECYNDFQHIKNITYIFIFIFILLSIPLIYKSNLNALNSLLPFFIFYYSMLTFYIMTDITNAVMILKSIAEGCKDD